MGIERTPNESQHTKLTLEKKIIPPFLPGFELVTFQSRVRRSTSKLSRRVGRALAHAVVDHGRRGGWRKSHAHVGEYCSLLGAAIFKPTLTDCLCRYRDASHQPFQNHSSGTSQGGRRRGRRGECRMHRLQLVQNPAAMIVTLTEKKEQTHRACLEKPPLASCEGSH